MEFAIKGVDISKSYGKSIILDNCSFLIDKSQIYGLIGKNGAGKTTLLKIISHIIPNNKFKGKVLYKSEDYKDMGSLIESSSLFKDLSVRQNFGIYTCLYSDDVEESIKEMDKLIEIFKLKSFLNKKVNSLSFGMMQKVRIALSFFTKSKIIILDEPFNGLDIDGVMILREHIQKTSKVNKKSIIITSHNTDEMEKICDKFGILHKAKILEKTKEELVNENISLENLYLEINRR